jgi:hypothetical protein
MKKNLYEVVFIRDMDLTVKTKKVLMLLEVYTLADLHLLYLLNTLPKLGTVLHQDLFANIDIVYCEKVNEEIKQMLKDYWEIEELEHIGA